MELTLIAGTSIGNNCWDSIYLGALCLVHAKFLVSACTYVECCPLFRGKKKVIGMMFSAMKTALPGRLFIVSFLQSL